MMDATKQNETQKTTITILSFNISTNGQIEAGNLIQPQVFIKANPELLA